MSNPIGVTYVKTTPHGTSYTVISKGKAIGTVGRFQMGAAQFGQKWLATTRDGRKSTQFTSRDAAAGWLLKQTGG